MASHVIFVSSSAFPPRGRPERNSRARCSSQTQTAPEQQIHWGRTEVALAASSFVTPAGVAGTTYRVFQQWHRVDKLAEDVPSLKVDLTSLKKDMNRRFDKQDLKLDKVIQLLDERNRAVGSGKQLIKMRHKMDKTHLRVSQLERNTYHTYLGNCTLKICVEHDCRALPRKLQVPH